MAKHPGDPRDLRIIVIDDSVVDYSAAYPHLEVVRFGEGLSRIGTWRGLIALLLEDGIPDFDLLLYDVNFDTDRTLSKAGSDQLDSGGVRTLGMVLALAVLAGRRPSSGMPIAQSAFTAFRQMLVDDRGAVHTYALLRALEDEPPAGLEADRVAKALPDAIADGIRQDLGRITTKAASPLIEDLVQIIPSYRKHFMGRCDKSIIVLDEAALSDALDSVRSIPRDATREFTESKLAPLELVVSHAGGEEALRLRSLFAERANIAGADLFLKGEDEGPYDDYYRANEAIDHGKLGPGDFLELLAVVTAQHRPLYPVVSRLLAAIREAKDLGDAEPDRGGRDDDKEHYLFHEKWTWVCNVSGITGRSQQNRVAFVALLFAYLEYLHAHETQRPCASAKVTAVRQTLSAHEHFPRTYLRPEYNGSYQEVMRTEFKKGRLRPGDRVAGIAYWAELNKRYGASAGLPDCLR